VSIPSRLVGSILPLVLVACAANAPPRTPPAPVVPPKIELAPPPALAPNVLRDRRALPGVRADAKPLVLPGAKKCGKVGRVFDDAATRTDLLGGRFTIGAPASAKSIAAPDGAPAEIETRVVVEIGDASPPRRGEPSRAEALAIGARETFQLDPDMYEAEPGAPVVPAKLDVEGPKFLKATFREVSGLEIEPVTIDGVRAYAARPKEPNAPPGKDTALVLALLVAHPDGMLETVTFHVRGEFVRNATGDGLVGCTRVAEKMASTIVKGPRAIDRTAGARTVLGLSANDALTLRVPADYVIAPVADGARIYKLRPLGLFAGSITVALKREPSEIRDADATAIGKLLGKETTWRGKTSRDGGGFYFAAAELEDKRLAEVLLKATRQAKVLDEFRGVAETLAVEKR
jgi:hypothetical protein